MNFKPLLLLPPLVLGIAGFMWMTSGDHQPPQTREATRLAVRVMTVTPEPMVVTATGYGRVEAERSWTAVAQVDGRVVDMAPGLAVGTLVEKDALLVQIDTTDFELAIQKSKANIAAAEATLAELDRQEANSRRLLEVEERIRDVTQAEYDRINNLVERGTSTAAALDTVQKSLLAQENAVINLTNTLELFPAQRASAEATLAVRQAELAEAERGLENTTMTAPFRGRVSEAAVEQGQFVRTGEQLLTLDAIDAVEVVGSFQPQAFSSVIQTAPGQTIQQTSQIDTTKVVNYLKVAGVTAYVRLEVADFDARYPAELVRFRGTIDDETGTIGMAVRVRDPLMADGATQRPPLSVGGFVSVVLETPAPGGTIAIPRTALHQDDSGAPFVYLADAEDRLAIAPVVLGPVAGDRIFVRSGLADADRLVLSAPRPPIEGMPLTPVAEGAAQ
ncbi:efflux RND transporter periplasmic adaptor subunit [Aurantimonas marina]|uniref:efflux RND transporter periplasmic adaptor subunit n=1 Tax=Aurantimonas marina TaxID=2780508 RepID=UPI0019D1166F|nr:HlyD family efflux transporter periplasmic adaptor subunit [Aurantimonas marina]